MTERSQNWVMMTSRQVRIGSLVMILGLACQHILVPMFEYGPSWLNLLSSLFGGLAGRILPMWIAVSVPGWRGVMPGELDEREIAERHRSFVVAYRITGTILLIIGSYGLGIKAYYWPAPSVRTGFEVLWTLAWIHLAMPGIILAWHGPRGGEDENPLLRA